MIERKLLPLAVAVFVLTAGLSGSATVAVLSDSATVNVQVSPGNVTATVVDSPTAPAEGNVTATENDTEELTVDEVDGIVVALDPAEGSVDAGETTEYDVVVRGASDGINAYDLRVTLSDPTVAKFQGFEHEHDLTLQNATVSGDEIQVDAGAGVNETIRAAEYGDSDVTEIVLGTVTVAGNASGQAELEIDEDRVGVVGSVNGTDQRYDIGAVEGSKLTVSGPPSRAEANGNSGSEQQGANRQES